MRYFVGILLLVTLLVVSCEEAQIDYPDVRKVDTTDVYFGTVVPDPYRWLEADTSEAVARWVKVQNEVTFDYLEQIPFRQALTDRLTELWDYPRYSAPAKHEDYYFFYKNDGLQDQSVLYIMDALDGTPEVFLDPNTFSEEGTASLAATSVSTDGRYMAYGISRGGSDWRTFYVKDIHNRELLSDTLRWVKFSGAAWYGDGFFYSRYDAPAKGKALSQKNEYHKVYYHALGTSQRADELIYEAPDHPTRNFYTSTTYDERFLILYASESTHGNMLFAKRLDKPEAPFRCLADDFEHNNQVVGNIGNELLVRTDNGAPKYRLVRIDPEKPEREHWKTVLSEQEEVLQGVTIAGGKLLVRYMRDASSRLYVHSLSGKREQEIELPALGTVGDVNGKPDDSLAFYTFTSFTYPPTIYKYHIPSGTSQVFRRSDVDFDPDAYKTRQVFYKSKDGTEVPMFIVHRQGLDLDGKRPTLLYGYGGFNISILPGFSISRIALLEHGAVLAVANLRGGGEYGEEWHQDGMLLNKQNVFDDFIHAAEYLINEGYTAPERLAIEGRSNGGLLVGAVMTQRPELFGVALPAVGVMDMLRFHRFTIGWAWAGEYGSSEDSVHFENLYGYSPLHNLRYGACYPATLLTTADHDDRVVPAHSFKFISALQEHQSCNNPTLIRIETKAGHGAGKPVSKRIEERADIWAFLFYNMKFTPAFD